MEAESIYEELIRHIVEVDDLGSVNIKAAQELKQKFIPKSIYKYRLGKYDECGKCWDIENLKNNQIRMTLPESFNDPYDSFFNIAIKANNEIEKRLLDEMLYKPAKRSMRICCFSESIESMLMWTHYANEHKGFALEYGPNDKSSVALQLWPVFYREKLFDISDFLTRIRSNLIPLLPALHKAIDWKYEKEWRLIAPGGEGENISMPRPKAIYMGSNVCPRIEEDLTEIATERRIKLYRMSHDRHEFKMDMTLVAPKDGFSQLDI